MSYQNKCQNRIKELRMARGHNLRDFVKTICHELDYEVSTATISLLESHRRENPTWELVDVLCDYFDVTPDYLMGKTDKRTRRDGSEPSEAELVQEDKEGDASLPPECGLIMAEFEARMKQAFLSYKKNDEGRKA